MMVPNLTLHPAFGKIVFALADLLCGYLLLVIIQLQSVRGAIAEADTRKGAQDMPTKPGSLSGQNSRATAFAVSFWLFNPLVFTVSTRGNADALICLLVLGMSSSMHD